MTEWITDRKKPGGLTVYKIGIPVRLRVDFGAGESECDGRAYGPFDGGGELVFADEGGWCTQYVKAWKPIPEIPHD